MKKKSLLIVFLFCSMLISCAKQLDTEAYQKGLEEIDAYIEQNDQVNEEFYNCKNALTSDSTFLYTTLLTQLENKSQKLHKFINECKSDVQKLGEIDAITGEMQNPGESMMNYRYWMFPKAGSGKEGNDLSNGFRGCGKGYEMKENLDEYTNWINVSLDSLNQKGALPTPPKMVVSPAQLEPGRQETWEYFTFGESDTDEDDGALVLGKKPVWDNLVVLHRLEMKILEMRMLFFEQLSATGRDSEGL